MQQNGHGGMIGGGAAVCFSNSCSSVTTKPEIKHKGSTTQTRDGDTTGSGAVATVRQW